jgi:hypothetical protein
MSHDNFVYSSPTTHSPDCVALLTAIRDVFNRTATVISDEGGNVSCEVTLPAGRSLTDNDQAELTYRMGRFVSVRCTARAQVLWLEVSVTSERASTMAAKLLVSGLALASMVVGATLAALVMRRSMESF